MNVVKSIKKTSVLLHPLFIVLAVLLAQPALANGCGSNIVICSHSGSYGDINAPRAANMRAKLSNSALFGPTGVMMPETFSFVSIPEITASELANNACQIYFSGYDTASLIDSTEQAVLNNWLNSASDRYVLAGCDSSGYDSVCTALNRPVVNYPNTPVEIVDSFPPNPVLCSGAYDAEIAGGASSYFSNIGSDIALTNYVNNPTLIEAITDSLNGNGKYLLTGDINMWVTPNSSISSGPDISLTNDYFIVNTFKFATDNICGRVNTVTGTNCPTSIDPTDYADAPASYGSPNHRIAPEYYLGSNLPDSETGPQASVDASADDMDNTDDEDGVSALPVLITGMNETLAVTVHGAGGYLQAWIDWNRDGDFADANEQVASDLQLASGTAGVINVPLVIPTDAVSGQSYLRLRWSTTAGLNALLGANNGEVEDFVISIQGDSDNDGLTDYEEAALGTDPEATDTDNDGLSDYAELAGVDGDRATAADNTNPLDADSDDDGLSDGAELAGMDGDPATAVDNTDPNNADSDADGVQDGTESGVTAPVLAGISTGSAALVFAGTDVALFIADSDPASRTDPNNPDTDGGGDCDGANAVTSICVAGEDADNNGAIGADETDPLLANDDFTQRVQLQLRAMLQGPFDYATGLMHDQLRTKAILPTQQPYTAVPFQYDGTEQLASALYQVSDHDAVVDWVLAELRAVNDPDTVLATKALLIQRDGDVIDAASGALIWRPKGVASGTYYVVLRHRNHLSVMTAAGVTLTHDSPVLIDFSVPSTAVRGDYTRLEIDGQALMYAGDVSADHRAIANGPEQDSTILLSEVLSSAGNPQFNANYLLRGYYQSDLNMDGKTIFTGPDNDTNILLTSVFLHPENNTFAANYIINGCMAAPNWP